MPGPEIKYDTQALGINKFKSMTKKMYSAGGLKDNFTNHSGKRTCATQMYLSGRTRNNVAYIQEKYKKK